MSNVTEQTFVIVGAGLAGAKAAETLRDEGFDGRVVLVGDEPARPYERPPLSKAYLRGEEGFDAAAVHDAGYYVERDIELRTGTSAVALDPAAGELELAGGERVAYDRLLLATGSEPRRLQVPGAELPGVHYLRTVADADALRAAVTSGAPVVVIGGGWIGCEVAASARQLGADVALVELGALPLERVLGPDMGTLFRDLHVEHGVRLHLGVGIESIEGTAAVEAVRLADGTVLPAGAVVVGVGVRPRTELAERAGLQVRDGVLADTHLATNDSRILVAGDVANARHPVYGEHVRVEHWSAALNQGPAAARNMLGRSLPYNRLPYFFSDQYDLGMEYRGRAGGSDELVLRGDPADRKLLAFWLRDERVVAAMNVNVWDQGDAIEALLRPGAPRVDAALLADPDVDLGELGAAAAA